MLALVRSLSRPTKTRQLSQHECIKKGSRYYQNCGNQQTLGPVKPARLAAAPPSFCPSGPVRTFHTLFSARSIASSSSASFTSPRQPRLPRPLLDSSDFVDKAYYFSTTSRPVMGATKIDGTAIAKRIREGLHAQVLDNKKINPRFVPSLKIIQGDCPVHQPASRRD